MTDESIRLFESKILDGRNRYRACVALTLEPKCLDLPADLNPWDYAWSANAERRHLAPGTRAVVFEFFAKESAAWEEARWHAQAEANRKRSEAARERSRSEEGVFQASRPSNDVPLDEQPASKKSRDNKTATKKAKAAGVSHATAERAHAVVENRPDLTLSFLTNSPHGTWHGGGREEMGGQVARETSQCTRLPPPQQ